VSSVQLKTAICFFVSDFRMRMVTTPDEWTSILDLAARWNFQTIRLLAIERLARMDSPIDKIVLGRRHGITEWLPDAYEAVCKRQGPLTHEEGIRLGMEDVIKISAVRQAYGFGTPRYDPRLLSVDLPKLFELEEMHMALPPVPDDTTKPEVMSRGDHVVVESVEEPKISTSAFTIGIRDLPGSPDMKPAADRSPIRALTKMKKKKIDLRKLEEQQRQAREQEEREQEEHGREQAQREMQKQREPEERERRDRQGGGRLGFFK